MKRSARSGPTEHTIRQAVPAQAPIRRDWLALAALCIGFFLLLVDSTIISVALPALMKDLGAGEQTGIWVNSAYLFAYAIPLLVAGRLGDRFGARGVYLLGLGLFTAASLLCALSPTTGILILWRVVQGLGAALMTPQSMTIIRRIFTFPALATALGIWASVGGTAAVSGPLLGGVLVGTWGWQSIFLVNVPIGIAAWIAAWRWIPRSARLSVSIPLASVLISGAGAFAIVAGIHEGAASPGGIVLGLMPAWLLLCVGAVLVGGVVYAQRGRPDIALLPVVLFRGRGFVMAALGSAAASFTVGAAMIPVMIYLQDGRGLDPIEAALTLVPMGVVSAVAAPFAGRSVNARGSRFTAIVGSVSLTVSMAAAAVLVLTRANEWSLSAAFVLYGFANSFIWAPLSVAALTAIPDRLMGAAAGAYNAVKQAGGVLGSAATAAFLAIASEGTALAVLAVSAALCVMAAAMLGPAVGSSQPGHPGRKGPDVLESNPGSFLGYATGPVVQGEGRGKKLGFPTANIDVDPATMLPGDGVYAGRLTILQRADPDDARPSAAPLAALVSIGPNATFNAPTRTIEAYILDFDEDIYGCRAEVSVEWFIRPQIKFETVDDLIAQMNQDEVRGREYFQFKRDEVTDE